MQATFFIMTIVLDKPNWMSRNDLRRLDAAGHTIAAHTWDHHRADRYSGNDWKVQFDRPRSAAQRVERSVRRVALLTAIQPSTRTGVVGRCS